MTSRFETKPGASSLVHDTLEQRPTPAAVGKRTLTEQLSQQASKHPLHDSDEEMPDAEPSGKKRKNAAGGAVRQV